MLENFQLVTILKTTGGQTRLLQIPLHQGLQNKLAESWQVQHDEFVNNVDEIDFDAGYTPEDHERFRLREYELPEWIIEKNSHTVRDLDPISAHEDLMGSIKGLAAFARNDQGEEIILFQNFSPSHVIRPGRFLFLQNDTYETAQHPGITLDSKLSALYLSAERKLLFNNLRTVNTFLPLAEFYKESSEQGIHETLRGSANRLATFRTWLLQKRLRRLRIVSCDIRYSPIGGSSKSQSIGSRRFWGTGKGCKSMVS